MPSESKPELNAKTKKKRRALAIAPPPPLPVFPSPARLPKSPLSSQAAMADAPTPPSPAAATAAAAAQPSSPAAAAGAPAAAPSSSPAAADSEDAKHLRLYRAVADGRPVEAVLSALEDCRSRSRALNKVHYDEPEQGRTDTPLRAAWRLKRHDVVRLLLGAGAYASAIAPRADSMAILIAYGDAENLRALLSSGKVDANKKLKYALGASDPGGAAGLLYPQNKAYCHAVHLCIVPPRSPLTPSEPSLPHMQLECLRVLVQVGGADLNKSADYGTPLEWVLRAQDSPRAPSTAVLCAAVVALRRAKVIYEYAKRASPVLLRQLIAFNSWAPNTSRDYRGTPLMQAIRYNRRADRGETILELARRTSPQYLRMQLDCWPGPLTALDFLLDRPSNEPWWRYTVMLLLFKGVSYVQSNAKAALVLPVAIELMALQEHELESLEAGKRWGWRGHDEVTGLVFDLQHASEEEATLARRREEVRPILEEHARRQEEEQRRRERQGRQQRARRQSGGGGGRR